MNLKKGLLAESKGVEYLSNMGFEILDRNFHTRYGEIDIIAIKNSTLHFIEVKSGNSFHPSYNLTQKKLNRILQSVDIYLFQNSHLSSKDISIDLLTVIKDNIELIENITV